MMDLKTNYLMGIKSMVDSGKITVRDIAAAIGTHPDMAYATLVNQLHYSIKAALHNLQTGKNLDVVKAIEVLKIAAGAVQRVDQAKEAYNSPTETNNGEHHESLS